MAWSGSERCPECDYDLRGGGRRGTCPECGVFEYDEYTQVWKRERRGRSGRPSLVRAVALALLAAGMLLLMQHGAGRPSSLWSALSVAAVVAPLVYLIELWARRAGRRAPYVAITPPGLRVGRPGRSRLIRWEHVEPVWDGPFDGRLFDGERRFVVDLRNVLDVGFDLEEFLGGIVRAQVRSLRARDAGVG